MKQENTKLPYSKTTGQIIKSFYTVYNQFGYGFENDVYINAMFQELLKTEHEVSKNKLASLYYDLVEVGKFNTDIIVHDLILISIKSEAKLLAQHETLLYSQLRNSDLQIGLLFNFGLKPEFCRKSPADKPDKAVEEFNDLSFDE